MNPYLSIVMGVGGNLSADLLDRLERSLSQSEEAKRLGINRVEYSQMEHGMIEPIDYDQLRKDLSAL